MDDATAESALETFSAKLNSTTSLRRAAVPNADLRYNLDAIADQMNSRPRATHDWLSPLESTGGLR